MIPAEAVEAAASVIYERAYGPEGWEGLPDRPRRQFLDDAAAILTAAAPYMWVAEMKSVQKLAREAAWDEGYDAWDECCDTAIPCGDCTICNAPAPVNPYRSTK